MKNFLKTTALLSLLWISGVATASKKGERLILTSDNTIVMNQTFDSDSVAQVAQAAKLLDAKLPAGAPIYLVIDSGGGQISAGIELLANLNSLERPVHTVSIFSASMAFQTVQGLGTRYILENGTLMAHKAKGGFSGEFPGQIDSRYNYYKRLLVRFDKTVVDRTGGKHTLKSFQDLYENEYWCDGEDCIAQGLADKIVRASCDSSLSGVENVIARRQIFQGHVFELLVTKPQCPTITGILAVNVYIDGKALFNTAKTLTEVTEVKTQSNNWEGGEVNNQVFEGMSLETVINLKLLIEKELILLATPQRKVID